MARTVEEIEKLKRNWKSDPHWDLYDTDGFEEHKDELKAYQEECEAKWKEEREKEEKAIDEQAESLGIKGLYRMIIQHKELLERHQRAIEVLADGDSHTAYRILNGYEV